MIRFSFLAQAFTYKNFLNYKNFQSLICINSHIFFPIFIDNLIGSTLEIFITIFIVILSINWLSLKSNLNFIPLTFHTLSLKSPPYHMNFYINVFIAFLNVLYRIKSFENIDFYRHIFVRVYPSPTHYTPAYRKLIQPKTVRFYQLAYTPINISRLAGRNNSDGVHCIYLPSAVFI